MNTHADRTQENKKQSVASAAAQKQSGSESTFQFVDNRPEAITQRKLQVMANHSPQVKQAAQLQTMANNHTAKQQQLIQKKASPEPSRRENNTGLPDNLKTGMENLSGMSLDDVKVHRNSDKPTQLQAHAYAQGTDIHIASGQEKHLPHEAWHVVQQKQGRVKPTMQMKGKVNVNDDIGLEKEADLMGKEAIQTKIVNKKTDLIRSPKSSSKNINQRQISFDDDISSIEKKINVSASSGGAQGVLFIQDGDLPALVIKPETESALGAIEITKFTNEMISSDDNSVWTASAPKARLATVEEIKRIVESIEVGQDGRQDNIKATLEKKENNNKIVVYENSGGEDFLNYLATGPEKNDQGKEQTKKRIIGRKAIEGTAFAQLFDSEYCVTLGKVAAIDIFLGNFDRLAGAVNFENWMVNIENKSISLVDNTMTSMEAIDNWKTTAETNNLKNEDFDRLANMIAKKIVDLIKNQEYGGGKANEEDQKYIDKKRKNIKNNLKKGLKKGYEKLKDNARTYYKNMQAGSIKTLFEELLDYFKF